MNTSDTTVKALGRNLARLYGCHLVLCQDAIAKRLSLTPSDMKCLTVLNCYGSMTPGKLATYAGFTTGGITRILDHLESRGFVKRTFEATDRRTILIEPLPSGTYTFGENSVDFDPMITAMLKRYTEKEFGVILDFLGYGSELLKDMAEQLTTEQLSKKRSAMPMGK